MAEPTSLDSLNRENDELRRRLDEAESIVRAISKHEVDAFVVQQEGEEEGVLVLDGVDRPYRLLIERMQQGAALLSPDGTIIYVNGRLSELLEAPAAALRGATFSTYVAPGAAESFSRLLEQGASGDAEQEAAL